MSHQTERTDAATFSRSPFALSAILAIPLALSVLAASAASAQFLSVPVSPGYLGPIQLDNTALEGLVEVGIHNTTLFGGTLDLEYRVEENATLPGAVAPGFAIFDRTLLTSSNFAFARARYQIQFPMREIRAGLRRNNRYGVRMLNHYDELDLRRANPRRVRAGVRASLRDLGALDQSGRVRFARFSRALRVMTLDPNSKRWIRAVDYLRTPRRTTFRYGARANYELGNHGVDVQKQLVWTLTDYPGPFALGFPVPEPSALWILGSGIAMLVVLRRLRPA